MKTKTRKIHTQLLKRWSTYGVQLEYVGETCFRYHVSIDGRGVIAQFLMRREADVFCEMMVGLIRDVDAVGARPE